MSDDVKGLIVVLAIFAVGLLLGWGLAVGPYTIHTECNKNGYYYIDHQNKIDCSPMLGGKK